MLHPRTASWRGPEQDTGKAAGGTGLGVNGFPWRATLDTIAFMPPTSADPFGGVIITDRYAAGEAPAGRGGRPHRKRPGRLPPPRSPFGAPEGDAETFSLAIRP